MSQHVATLWPNALNMLHPIMLRYVALTCCNRFAGACQCWTDNAGICYVDMLRSFGRGFRFSPVVLWNVFKSNRVLLPCLHSLVKNLMGWKNFPKLLKPFTPSRVCITFWNCQTLLVFRRDTEKCAFAQT